MRVGQPKVAMLWCWVTLGSALLLLHATNPGGGDFWKFTAFVWLIALGYLVAIAVETKREVEAQEAYSELRELLDSLRNIRLPSAADEEMFAKHERTYAAISCWCHVHSNKISERTIMALKDIGIEVGKRNRFINIGDATSSLARDEQAYLRRVRGR